MSQDYFHWPLPAEQVDTSSSRDLPATAWVFPMALPPHTRDATYHEHTHARLMLNLWGFLRSWSARFMLDRQRSGVARAKAEGKYRGGYPRRSVRQAKWSS